MTTSKFDLDACRKLAAEERAVTERATPGPWAEAVLSGGHVESVACAEPGAPLLVVDIISGDTPADAAHIARSRTAVPALCDAVDALAAEVERLRAVVDALPRCACGLPATTLSTASGMYLARNVRRCDGCAAKWPTIARYDLPCAAALRTLTAGAKGER